MTSMENRHRLSERIICDWDKVWIMHSSIFIAVIPYSIISVFLFMCLYNHCMNACVFVGRMFVCVCGGSFLQVSVCFHSLCMCVFLLTLHMCLLCALSRCSNIHLFAAYLSTPHVICSFINAATQRCLCMFAFVFVCMVLCIHTCVCIYNVCEQGCVLKNRSQFYCKIK